MKEPTNWVRKVQASPTLHRDTEDPFSGAQIASGAVVEALRQAQVQVSVLGRRWAFH